MNETKKLADRILRKAAQESRPVKSSDFVEYARLDKFSVMELKDLLKDYGELKRLMPTGEWEYFVINDGGMVFAHKGGYQGEEEEEQKRLTREENDDKVRDAAIQGPFRDWIAISISLVALLISIIALFKE